jgi:hypothetical protein
MIGRTRRVFMGMLRVLVRTSRVLDGSGRVVLVHGEFRGRHPGAKDPCRRNVDA